MKKPFLLTLTLTLAAMPVLGQDKELATGAPEASIAASSGPIWAGPNRGGSVLIDNGPLVTAPGAGFGGADASVLETAIGLGNFGFGHQELNGNRMADDFVLADDSTIDTCTFFAYQTGSTTTSTITAVNVQIWDGEPGNGGSVIFGDPTTNLLMDSAFSNIYRSIDTDVLLNIRPIMANTVDMGGLELPAGTYWIDWQSDGSLGSGPWAPAITIAGQTNTGNGLQSLGDDGATWAPAIDVNFPQGFPFICTGSAGSVGLPIPTIDWRGITVMLLLLAGAAFFMMRRQAPTAA